MWGQLSCDICLELQRHFAFCLIDVLTSLAATAWHARLSLSFLLKPLAQVFEI